MRTLHADLTTAQKSASRKPYIEVTFLSRDGATSRTYTTSDTPHKVTAVTQVETRTHTDSLSSPQGRFGTIIRIRDADNAIGDLDFQGYLVKINWGLVTTSGNRTSPGSPAYVFSKRRISTPQDIYVEFMCLSLWELAEKAYLNNVINPSIKYQGTVQVRHILMDLLTEGSGTKIALDDGGAFTDYTDEAVEYATNGPISITASSPATNDAFYIGGIDLFNRITFDTHTAVGTHTWAVEYWNGSSWTALSSSTDEYYDGTSNFTNTGIKIFAFQVPSDWATTTVDGTVAYFIRFRLTAVSGTQVKANRILIGRGLGMEEDTASITGLDFQPKVLSQYAMNNAALTDLMLRYTLAGIYVRLEGFHIREIDNSQTVEDYTYDTADSEHVVFESAAHVTSILPNKYIFTDVNLDDVVGGVEGDDEESSSIAAWGTFPVISVDSSVASSAVGDTLAGRLVEQKLRDRSQGFIFAKMNMGQEVWDWVRMEDTRINNNFEGRVTRISRIYAPQQGIYAIELELGNFIGSNMVNPEDLFRWTTTVPALPPLPQIPNFLDTIGAIFNQARDILQRESVGGLTDLGPNPSIEAQIARDQFEQASLIAGRVASQLPRYGEEGFRILEQIRGTNAGQAAALGNAGVAPVIRSSQQLQSIIDRGISGFSGYLPQSLNRTLNNFTTSYLTAEQRRVIGAAYPDFNVDAPIFGYTPAQDIFTRLGRISPTTPLSPGLTDPNLFDTPASIPNAFTRNTRSNPTRTVQVFEGSGSLLGGGIFAQSGNNTQRVGSITRSYLTQFQRDALLDAGYDAPRFVTGFTPTGSDVTQTIPNDIFGDSPAERRERQNRENRTTNRFSRGGREYGGGESLRD